GLAWIAALDEQVGGHDAAPAATAGRVKESADQAQRGDNLGSFLGIAMHDAAIEKIEAERGEIGQHERLRDRGIDRCQNKGAKNAAKHARDYQPEEQLPVDIAVGDMADA